MLENLPNLVKIALSNEIKRDNSTEDFAKRVPNFMRPFCNVISMELLRVNAEVRTCRHLSCSNSMITTL